LRRFRGSLARAVAAQLIAEFLKGQRSWELSDQEYTYDKAGRLTKVQDDVHSPLAVDGCTIRSYAFDENSNRTSLNTKAPDGSGDCQPGAAGTSKSYSYDSADRLTGSGITYDKLGRTTRIPAEHSGGGVLTYTYYANEQVRTISQDGISKTYALDPAGRQRSTIASGGTTHTETLHYSDGSDSPSWTSVANTQGQEVSWERTITGIDGDLAAIRTHNSGGDQTVLQLSNLHGDTATTDPQATALTDRFEADEYGNPRQQSGRRYGWLGAKQRRTQLPSGVIQMGVRSYLPSLARFTSTDPVLGGSATAYDYGNADPINQFDLDGRQAGICTIVGKVKRTRFRGAFTGKTYNSKVFGGARCMGDIGAWRITVRIRRRIGGDDDETVYEQTVHGYGGFPLTKLRTQGFWDHWNCKGGEGYNIKVTFDWRTRLRGDWYSIFGERKNWRCKKRKK
jgi:RHS repeat-associated protein